ncbi:MULTISPECIES: hemolysin XhlA family protein [Bacillus cereus group]|uniref:Hemolysin XhlA family protein n=1 Tax=Bacillus proteolyticus TaxID=2026192 RepID=A0ABV3I9B9_9BACI|nr:hemolysin XhlA family protein [Bacillus proteolyticus]MBJ8103582.1 hemolysin XhlA family protein [Bacillus cereus group sp. N8]MED1509022.1 hemolysin XhlA family protein [Bacillus proteolyticus]
MPEENHDDFTKVIIGLTRVETKIDGFGNVREVAIEAQQSAKSAHLRVDRLDKLVFWIGTTVIGAVITGGITMLFKVVGK